MVCPKCNGENVTVQAVSTTKSKGKGAVYWIFVGWWLEPILWLFLTIPMLFAKLFGGGKRIRSKVESYAVCQDCGKRWKV